MAKTNGVLDIQSEFELGRRSISGSLGQIGLIASYTLALSNYERFPSFYLPIAGVIFTFNVFQFYLTLRQASYYPEKRKRWNFYFTFNHIVTAGAWGLLAFMVLDYYGLSSYATMVIVLVGSGLAAGLSSAVSSRQSLARPLIVIAVGTPLVKLLLMTRIDIRAVPMALIFAAYIGFLWFQIQIQNENYWDTIRNRNFLLVEKNRIQSVLDAIPGLVSWIGFGIGRGIGGDLVFRGVNRNYAENYGAGREEFLGKELEFKNKDEEFIRAVREFMASPEDHATREVRMTVHGKPRHHLLVMRKAKPISKEHEDGETYLIAIDIESLKQAQSELDKERVKTEVTSKLAAIGEFTASVAHEIKNPLGGAMISLQLIQKNLASSPIEIGRTRTLVDRTLAMMMRIKDIVNRLTKFSRKTEAEPYVSAHLNQIVQDAVELMSGQFLASGVTLQLPAIDPKITLWCRPVEISQVLVNLLSNALDAVKSLTERWVRVEVKIHDHHVAIVVTDSGVGIPQEVADRVFEPLFTTKPAGVGTGLGLSISREIVERHGGHLVIDQSASHTTFVVELQAA